MGGRTDREVRDGGGWIWVRFCRDEGCKSGGDLASGTCAVLYDEEKMDARSEQQKSLLIQNDITQALFPPCSRPTGSLTACVMSVARALAYIRCIRLGKAQPHPRAENSSC